MVADLENCIFLTKWAAVCWNFWQIKNKVQRFCTLFWSQDGKALEMNFSKTLHFWSVWVVKLWVVVQSKMYSALFKFRPFKLQPREVKVLRSWFWPSYIDFKLVFIRYINYPSRVTIPIRHEQKFNQCWFIAENIIIQSLFKHLKMNITICPSNQKKQICRRNSGGKHFFHQRNIETKILKLM